MGAGTFSSGVSVGGMGAVSVEDAALMQVRFAGGALGSFEATRFATGRKNRNLFEIYGSDGSLCFDLERLNELEFFDRTDRAGEQGFRTILATEGSHAYIPHWWPPGHTIGYEHTFVHAVVDFLAAVAGRESIAPSFADGVSTMAVLESGLHSARSGRTHRGMRPPFPQADALAHGTMDFASSPAGTATRTIRAGRATC